MPRLLFVIHLGASGQVFLAIHEIIAHATQHIQARIVRFARTQYLFRKPTLIGLKFVAQHKLSLASISQVFHKYLATQFFSARIISSDCTNHGKSHCLLVKIWKIS